jgi:hypothetical protein
MAGSKKWDREIVIDKIMTLRIKGYSTKSIIDLLRDEFGYKQSQSYTIFRDAQARIKEMYEKEHGEAFAEAVSQLEKVIEKAEKDNNQKMKLESIKELNKLLGLHRPQRLDITSDGKSITDINITIIDGSKSNES